VKKLIAIVCLASLFALVGGGRAALSPEQMRQLPHAATEKIDFVRDIQPLFEASCAKCHGRGKDKGGFRLDTRETFLKGGDSGPVVFANRSAESRLIELVSGLNPDSVMPAKGTKLTPKQVGLLRAWIDQGMPWEADVSFGRPPPLNLRPRRPELPAAHMDRTNPIDRLLVPYFETHKTPPVADVIGDRIFARRAFLDVIGLLPPAMELEAFVVDKRPDKRDRLVARLLADRRGFAGHWITFWNDLLRNDYKGAGATDGLRSQVSGFVYPALVNNLPYDRFVAELVNPTRRDSAGFVNGIRWRGDLSASQKPPMQAAQNVAQVFLGANLKCASCHDSFVNDWSLADAYGMAAIYADETRLELFQCDRPTGQKVAAKFLFPELGDIPSDAPGNDRVRRLSEIITSPKNGRLTRTIVNRLWAQLFGRGLVEPLDDMDQPAWNQDLLDWLAEDLAAHKYDLNRTLQLILTSQAYQMPSVNLTEGRRAPYVFRGPAIRRMTAEQFRDAIGTLTGLWHEEPEAQCDFTVGLPPNERARLTPKSWKWIWNDAGAARSADYGTIYFYKSFRLQKIPDEALVVASADSGFKLYVNGVRALTGGEWQKVSSTNINSHLQVGENTFTVEAVNLSEQSSDSTARNTMPAARKPAGFVLYARLRRGADVMDVATDSSWKCSTNRAKVVNAEGANPKGLLPAAELGGADMPPWAIGGEMTATLSKVMMRGKARAGVVSADPLALAMSRPLREQVVSTRPSVATTLQALELSNGATLNELVERGAANLLGVKSASSAELVTQLYAQALGRRPTARESEICTELLGPMPDRERVQDILWSLVLLPEFQLIY